MRCVISRPWDFELLEEDDGRLVLVVLCGSAGQFEVALELDASERQAFELQGEPFILALKQRVFDRPVDFQGRDLRRGPAS